MPSKVFNTAKLRIANNSVNLATGNFYACLVTSEPAVNLNTRSQLAEAAGGTYSPKDLSGNPQVAASGNDVNFKFNNPGWGSLDTTSRTPIRGVVIVEKAGSNFSTNDKLMCYCEFSAPFTPNGSTMTAVGFFSGVMVIS